MPAVAAPDPSTASSTDAYRRAARRLRCRFAGQPGRLHRSLKALADAPPAPVHRRVPSQVQYSSSPHPPHGSASFAEHVARSLTSPVLRYSQRLQFIRDARRFGISRFEANLVIAAVLERRKSAAHETRDRSAVSVVTTFLLVQSAMALGAWWTLFR